MRLASRLSLPLLLTLAACAQPTVTTTAPPAEQQLDPELVAMYAELPDGDVTIPAIPPKWLSERNKRREVDYWTDEKPGTIIVDPFARYLYLVEPNNRAMRYGVAVGEEGRGFSGEATIPFTREWPRWTPTQNMIKEDPEQYGPVAGGMEGGLQNPLGARTLYLFRGGKDTFYRIHGTANPWSIGQATSAGCIRLYNQDIVDLHERVKPGAHVVVLTEAETGKGTVPPGTPLPPVDYAETLAASNPGATAATMSPGQ
ncbi:L,D-transpeptidase [Cereibacter changlensis]|uniref:L,D-transpeptidase n=1 Tax=Cereibacter changlensis TaxID=402884 RepID=A0A4U0YU28_9RHOB|nr:L,D-transpeptidase [Cereibacter changlensis]TKA94199.1 L,D-transpeptidase [Cereibacter changlensis]